jgi:hypothetical protein
MSEWAMAKLTQYIATPASRAERQFFFLLCNRKGTVFLNFFMRVRRYINNEPYLKSSVIPTAEAATV